ncbi:glycosyltransferase family 2 protein [Prolixibacteraceae bacterium Z1-6]|uniref:Glycosyltransferase family 2 protein n=1 Tax=Draconibacterium aestuarii TaxID=2998507 RepID=A0A9X3FBH3_9BACT|nr:glycosyltransferase family 2 protein [Prolixibacteraceae bacterium Z1-6]
MINTYKIAILITCHNRRQKTLNCLKYLFKVSLFENYQFEVFLVDDGSIDGTSDAVRKEFPQVKIIVGNGNLYWNKGMYLAWTTAAQHYEYDYYVWLNDDVILYPTSLKSLLHTAREYPKSIICGTLRSKNEEIPTYGGRDRNGKILTPNNSTRLCSLCNGNLVLISKHVFLKVGYLDPVFPHAIGDFDYSLRAKKLGIQTIVSPGYLGICESNPSLPKWCYPKYDLLTRLKVLYSPLGNSHPKYYFIFDSRHFGLLSALKHFLSIHFRAFYPSLWKQ